MLLIRIASLFSAPKIPSVSGITTDLQSGRIATIHKRVAAAQREGHLSLCESRASMSLFESCRPLWHYWSPWFLSSLLSLTCDSFRRSENLLHLPVLLVLWHSKNRFKLMISYPVLPHLLEDSRKVMERWGTSGRFDPFEKIYDVGIQLNNSIPEADQNHVVALHLCLSCKRHRSSYWNDGDFCGFDTFIENNTLSIRFTPGCLRYTRLVTLGFTLNLIYYYESATPLRDSYDRRWFTPGRISYWNS